jgi:hypothetical protein
MRMFCLLVEAVPVECTSAVGAVEAVFSTLKTLTFQQVH